MLSAMIRYLSLDWYLNSFNCVKARRQLPTILYKNEDVGKIGENRIIHNREETLLPGKGTFIIELSDVLSICTPGDGGYGIEEE